MKAKPFATLLPLMVVAALSTLSATASGVKHVTYEAPFDDWIISKNGKASVKANCGFDGKRSCFALEGTESSNPMISSPKIPDTMDGDTFLFRTLFKCTGSSRPYLGVGSAHYDITDNIYMNNTIVGNGWTETSAMLRLPTGSDRRLFVAMYYKEGTCYVDKVELTQVEVIPITEDPKYGLLGQDDTIYKDGKFESKIFEKDFYTTINPHIKSISAGWNSNRAYFSDGKNITFDYSGIGSMLSKPLTVESTVHYFGSTSSYATLMESSDGGKTWADVGTFRGKTGPFTFTLSSKKHVMFCIIMKNSAGSVQISNVKVTSAVSEKPSTTVHSKMIVHVPVEENGIALSVTGNSDTKGKFNIKLTNTGNTSIENFKFDYSSATSSGADLDVDKSSGSINQGGSMDIVGEVKFSSSDDTVINYGIHNNDGTATYASGRFIVAKTHFYYDDSYGNYIAEDSGHGTLWWCGSTYKISKERAAPRKNSKKSAIDLYAAKNEYEAFQLVLKASDSDQTISDVSITPLTSVDDKSVVIDDISVRRVMYVKTDYATDEDYGRAGEYWPDPLVPLDLPYTCPAGENCPFWVLVHAPFGAKEGRYKGSVSLTASGKTMEADVSLQVWNFTIPKKQRLKSLFGFNTDHVNAYHHIAEANNTIKGIVYDKYLASMSRHRISPTYGYPLHWYWSEFRDDKLHFYYDNFIERVKMTHSEDGFGFSSDVIVLPGVESKIGDYKWGTSKHKELFDGNNRLIQEVLRNNSLLDEFYVYWMDEPTEDQYDYVIEVNDAIKAGAPDIKILLTEQVEEKLKDHVDAWCPVFSRYVKDDLVERQKLGEEAWTYVCCCPTGKRITLFIDHPATELRLWNWHSFKTGVNGILMWATVYWTKNPKDTQNLQDPYTDVMSWDRNSEGTQWGNGDGKFFYPPLNWNKNKDEPLLDDPIETIRLEILRDGIEDWEYFTTLKEISTSKEATSEQKATAKVLLDIPDSIVGVTDTEYATTPEEMLKRRHEVGKFINAYFCGEEYVYSSSISEGDDRSSSTHKDGDGSSFVSPVSFVTMVVMIAVAFFFHRH